MLAILTARSCVGEKRRCCEFHERKSYIRMQTIEQLQQLVDASHTPAQINCRLRIVYESYNVSILIHIRKSHFLIQTIRRDFSYKANGGAR